MKLLMNLSLQLDAGREVKGAVGVTLDQLGRIDGIGELIRDFLRKSMVYAFQLIYNCGHWMRMQKGKWPSRGKT